MLRLLNSVLLVAVMLVSESCNTIVPSPTPTDTLVVDPATAPFPTRRSTEVPTATAISLPTVTLQPTSTVIPLPTFSEVTKLPSPPVVLNLTTTVATSVIPPTFTSTRSNVFTPTAPPPIPSTPTVQIPQTTRQPTPLPAGQGQLTVINNVSFNVRIVLWGPADKSVDVSSGQTSVISLPTGSYGWNTLANRCSLTAPNLNIMPDNTVTVVSASGSCGYAVRWAK